MLKVFNKWKPRKLQCSSGNFFLQSGLLKKLFLRENTLLNKNIFRKLPHAFPCNFYHSLTTFLLPEFQLSMFIFCPVTFLIFCGNPVWLRKRSVFTEIYIHCPFEMWAFFENRKPWHNHPYGVLQNDVYNKNMCQPSASEKPVPCPSMKSY